jgi:hypothetical protein
MSGTGSLMIRNLRKANDYDKARLNQDELLKIAIANDNNIANARRSYRQGEVPALTPQQQQTPVEIQQDISKNYSDAITNLLSLGMDYREASEIVARLGADPTNLQILNNTFPSIKADFLKRFDVKRTTPTAFIEFFTKFREVFEETKGIADNSVLFNDKFDRIINNINDLRAITPTKDQIISLKRAINGQKEAIRSQYRNIRGDIADIGGIGGGRDYDREFRDIVNRLDRLASVLPTDAQWRQIIAGSDNTKTYTDLAQIQDALANVPSRDQIQEILDRVEQGTISVEELKQQVKAVADSMSGGFAEVPAYATEEVAVEAGRRLAPSEIASRPHIPLGVDASIDGRVFDSVGMTNEGQGGHLRIIFSDSSTGYSSMGYNREYLRSEINKSPALQQSVRRFTGEDWGGNQSNKNRLTGAFFHAVESDLQNPRKTGLVPSSSSSVSSEGSDIGWGDIYPTSSSAERRSSAYATKYGRSRSPSIESNPSPKTIKPIRRKVIEEEEGYVSPLEEPGGGGGRAIGKKPNKKKDEGGSGLRNIITSGRKPQILIKKIGRGIAPVEEPSHIEFGKHLLHANNLRKGILSLHHKGGGRVASIPVQNISEDLRDFIVDILQHKKASQKDYSRLPIQEQKLFEKFATGAGVFHNLGLKTPHDDDDKKNLERFEVLRGEWMAGNNSHELIRELRKLVIHFMDEGRLTKGQGRELLLNIN